MVATSEVAVAGIDRTSFESRRAIEVKIEIGTGSAAVERNQASYSSFKILRY